MTTFTLGAERGRFIKLVTEAHAKNYAMEVGLNPANLVISFGVDLFKREYEFKLADGFANLIIDFAAPQEMIEDLEPIPLERCITTIIENMLDALIESYRKAGLNVSPREQDITQAVLDHPSTLLRDPRRIKLKGPLAIPKPPKPREPVRVIRLKRRK